MNGEGSERDYVQSLERGFAVLLAFDEERTNPTLAELAAATGLSRPAVRRLLLTLQRLGYVSNQGTRWSLTPRVLTIGQHYTATNARIEIAQPHLLRLAERTDESASLGELDGDEVVYVARVPVRRIMTINVSVGTRVPARATSMGRVLLAWAGPERIDRFLERPLEACTAHTVTDPAAMRSALAEVRREGFAIVTRSWMRDCSLRRPRSVTAAAAWSPPWRRRPRPDGRPPTACGPRSCRCWSRPPGRSAASWDTPPPDGGRRGLTATVAAGASRTPATTPEPSMPKLLPERTPPAVVFGQGFMSWEEHATSGPETIATC